MSRFIFVCCSLMALCCSAWPQGERTKSVAYQEAQNSVLQARQQQRRDMLREALKLQEVEATLPARQMTAQEKAELRQQLRQQRSDPLK